MFLWSQQGPDCTQQNNNDNNYQNNYQPNPYPNYQVPSYQSPSYQESSYQGSSYQGAAFQGPSYQETLQAMIADTLRALCDIVQSTVQTSKQEIATLARMFIKKSSQSNCESDETPEEEYNVQPSESTDIEPVQPQSETNVGMDTSSSSSKPDPLMQTHNESTANTRDEAHNSTSGASSSLRAGLNASTTLPSMTKPANSTTESTSSLVPKETVSPYGAQSSNNNVSEVTNLTY